MKRLNLKIIKHENQLVIDSRQVAEMVGKEHAHLMRDIKGYETILSKNPNLDSQDFFISSSYKTEGNNKTYPCYLITKKGCDMVANKMTGEKGVLFTANYIEKFYEMEQQLHKPMSQLEIIAANAAALVEQEKQMRALAERQDKQEQQIKGIRDVVALNPNDWRKDSSALINKMAVSMGGYEHVKPLRAESYKLLDERMGVDLQCRLTNKRRRMADEGVCKSKRDKLNQLDVIADDKKLIEGYIAIIKEMSIKYGIEKSA